MTHSKNTVEYKALVIGWSNGGGRVPRRAMTRPDVERTMKGLFQRVVAATTFGLVAAFGLAPAAKAHNAVKLEQDECVFKIGPSTMHFIGYQRTGEEQEFCQDIAQTGPTVIALQAVSPEMRDMAIGARIVKDTGDAQKNLAAAAIASYAPKVYSNGIMTFEHDFVGAGRYAAIVTVRDDLGNEFVSQFPFQVGLYTFWGMIEYILYGVGFVSLIGVMWLTLRARGRRAMDASHAPA
jgi:hypothetical protein